MIIELIDNLFFVYLILIFGRILGSWVPELQQTQVMQFCVYCTDPYLNLFRKIIPPIGMMDLSPLVAIFSLRVIQGFLIRFIYAIS
ncbi:MAG: YggT family protein [Waddliaceae bacterium]